MSRRKKVSRRKSSARWYPEILGAIGVGVVYFLLRHFGSTKAASQWFKKIESTLLGQKK